MRRVLKEVVPAFQALRAAGVFGSAQGTYNMLNPSARSALPAATGLACSDRAAGPGMAASDALM